MAAVETNRSKVYEVEWLATAPSGFKGDRLKTLVIADTFDGAAKAVCPNIEDVMLVRVVGAVIDARGSTAP